MGALRVFSVLVLLALGVGGFPAPTVNPLPPERVVAEAVLKAGETLEGALRRIGFSPGEAAGIITALRGDVDMRRVQPGERLAATRDPGGALRSVTYWRTALERYEFRPEGAEWRVRKTLLPVVTRVVPLAGTVEGSLFVGMDRLNETPALTAMFVNLFEWDFDFAADSMPGDRFRLLVEKRYVYEEFVGYGEILIAQYQSAGRRRLTAVALPRPDGKTEYFDAEGRSVRKMFLRAPLDFTRVTSGFSQARRHPILGGTRPHLAVDYAAPPGTPVRAVADGVVEAAGWRGGNGISVTLRHRRGYQTMYNHLSRVEVRAGQRVRQRQVIGRVGSTGLSTGPHLDYRVMKKGRFVNPLSERFIPGAPVPPRRRAEFARQRDDLLGRLEREAPFATGA